MNLSEVINSVESIRKSIEKHVFKYKEDEIKVTASFGIAEFTSEHNEGIQIIEEADKQLYIAKEHGRNRIECVKY